jgi:predicted GNAT superfamily acetyltransferase
VAGSQAGGNAVIQIRKLTELDEFRGAVQLQKVIWGFDDIDLLPLRFFVVASRVGGQVLGAFDGESMIGFCLGIPGVKPGGHAYLHSHMLGVLPEYHNLGVGRRLKLRQREDALARGIPLIEWTFDPLELKNAFFNIERLGAIVRRYSVNQYGDTSSPLHGGLPTDRCYAEWWIGSARVRGVLDRRAADPPVRMDLPGPVGDRPEEAGQGAVRGPGGPPYRIAYPADIARIRAEDNARARAIQLANAEKFQSAFARGLAVTRFERTDGEGVYLLEPWHDD